VPDSIALSPISEIVIAWVAVSVVVAISFGVVAARLGNRRRLRDRRRGEGDRRASRSGDRRVGLPDPRPDPVERRMGPADRRGGPLDRRQAQRRPTVAA
jgi:hypothetical protein